MKKALAAGAAALSLVGGSFAVAAVSPVGIAGAQDDSVEEVTPEESTSPASHGIEGVLDDLVADGTITQAQADIIAERLVEARGEWRGGHHHRLAVGLDIVAEVLGLTVEDLAGELREGSTIAEIAGDDVDAVVDALVAASTARIDEAVDDGKITQERADEMLAGLEERITEAVNSDSPRDLVGRRGDRGPRGFGFGPGDAADDSETTTE